MSELKAKHVVDVYEAYTKTGDDDTAQVYLKSEADKVIAEKDAKIIQLTALIENYNRISEEIIDNLNHQKHKRCLAMANGCKDKIKYWHIRYTTASGYDRSYEKWKHRLFKKWLNRWLAIAEKFKE